MLKKVIIILGCLLLLDAVCFAKENKKANLIYVPEKINYYIFERPEIYNPEKEILLKDCHFVYVPDKRNSWKISYDSDNQYFVYNLKFLVGNYRIMSFIPSVEYTGVHTYGLNLGISYNF